MITLKLRSLHGTSIAALIEHVVGKESGNAFELQNN
jgi:hypothetical protein